MIKKYFIIIFFFFIFNELYSQNWNPKVCLNVLKNTDTLFLDSLTIDPNSIIVSDTSVLFELNQISNYILLKNNVNDIEICFEKLPYMLRKPIFLKNRNLYSNNIEINRPKWNDIQIREELFKTPGIEKSGVLSRGVSFGNNQDVFVKSSLNLQMEGEITDKIKLTASISDQNIPFQPEGNTQQIQEFDRVFISLKHPKWELSAGDIVIKNDSSFFMKFNKRVQGVHVGVNLGENRSKSYTKGAVSIAKGKFLSQAIQPIEGLQGPYRLNGANGEKFIIVLANSEQVYLDGKKLTRGFNYDYTIDYNRAEITFTFNVLITKYSRIRVDFEYTERNYSRTALNIGHHQKINNFEVYVDYFSEKDNPNQPTFFDLTKDDIDILSKVGDSVQFAFNNTFDSVNFSNELILYKKELINDRPVYVYSTNPDSAFFSVSFTQVADNNGDYIRENTSINGTIFKYVGDNNGNFVPGKIIPAPNQRQMVVIGSSYSLKRQKVFFELAQSKRDLNLISQLNDTDNLGYGYRFGTNGIGKDSIIFHKYQFINSLDIQFTDNQFRPLDRIRKVGFDRDWGSNQNLFSNDLLMKGGVGIVNKSGEFWKWNTSFRDKKTDVNGLKNDLDIKENIKKLQLRIKANSLQSEVLNKKNEWRKLLTDISYKNKWIVPGYAFAMEKNRITNVDSSRVVATSMNFDEHKFFIKSGDSSFLNFELYGANRKDYLPKNGKLEWWNGIDNSIWETKANSLNSTITSSLSKTQEILISATYRELEFKQNNQEKQKNILGRVDWNSMYFNRVVRSEMSYSVNSGRDRKNRFEYVSADPSVATHVWRDLNRNKIEEFEEFFLITLPENDSTFIKLFLPTDEYIMAFEQNFNYRLNIRAPLKWFNSTKIKKFISKFENFTVLTSQMKTTDDSYNKRLNPLLDYFNNDRMEDVSILSYNKQLRTTLFYQKSNPKFGSDFSWFNNEQKQLVVNGNDLRIVKQMQLNQRVNINKFISINTSLLQSNKISVSSYLINKNYTINEFQIKPSISYQPTTSVRISLLYDYSNKVGEEFDGNSETIKNDFGFELKVNQVSKRTADFQIHYIYNKSNVRNSRPIAYEMLEALQPGRNFLFSSNLLQRLSNGLNVQLSYEGRKSNEQKFVHIGKMQVSVLF